MARSGSQNPVQISIIIFGNTHKGRSITYILSINNLIQISIIIHPHPKPLKNIFMHLKKLYTKKKTIPVCMQFWISNQN